ncbi:MAG: acyl-[Bacteroidaceae bacterium]|nr:acyl-[acyl-carrier-protein] thioesterase [Bacteroidaceae bacterium]
MEKIGKYEFMAEPFHCDFSGRLFMGHLGNHMLNAADFHSTARGFGMSYLQTINRAWVLSRLAIEMDRMPRQYERFTVETWVESAMRDLTSRNFSGVAEDGAPMGYGRSIWAMIDTASRQPTDIFSIDDGAVGNWIEKDKPCPIDKGGRVKMPGGAQLVRSIDTYYSDVDINGHVNSVKYIEHVIDLWPLEWYRQHRVRRLEIAYVAEAHCGDRLDLWRVAAGPLEADVEVRKNGAEPVCRARLEFV